MEVIHPPDNVQSLFFASARIKEIKTVRNLLLSQNGTKLAFQKLPRHMRRRIMGHCTKRVPRSIRQVHRNQLEKSGLPPKSKRPSRKFRRRPLFLNGEITRRQRENKWLETHIWHAKRFHMVNKWAYKIPLQPTDKAFRACYRATMKHCLLQDISYVSCVELKGPQNKLIDGFKKITKSNEGLSMHAKAYISGNREGKAHFYTHLTDVPIGCVTFMWRSEDSNISTIWLWAHAAYFEEVLKELILLFDLTENIVVDPPSKQWKNKTIMLTDLRFELNRLRLTGPLSQAIISKALQPVNASLELNPWMVEYLNNCDDRQIFSEQLDYWKKLIQVQTPAIISPHIVFSLIIIDPRYTLPNQRTKALSCEGGVHVLPPRSGLSNGAIWNEKNRQAATESKLSHTAINELRSQLLVPGSNIKEQGAQIPIMLVQRPGNSKTGFCAGWDVIIPKNWAQCVWMSFIMWGARAGGYRETQNINFELSQQDIFPPDTWAGSLESLQLDETKRNRYFRLPPNKRTNYNKFSSFSPLSCNWKVLIRNWSGKTEEFDRILVLRNRKALEDLQLHLHDRKHRCVHSILDNSLVPVKITLRKGVASRYSMICLPLTQTDISKPPIELLKKDMNKEERNKLRKEHKALLQKLKRKRHNDRNKLKTITIDKSISKEFMRKMRDLWLPPIGDSDLRKSCSREILGFVTKGGVSLANGCSQGIGYIPITAMLKFLTTTKGNQVLCRNPNSRQYRCATLDIIL